MMSDTPETVAEKGKGVRLALFAFTHYIGENHPGDWSDCWCYPKVGITGTNERDEVALRG